MKLFSRIPATTLSLLTKVCDWAAAVLFLWPFFAIVAMGFVILLRWAGKDAFELILVLTWIGAGLLFLLNSWLKDIIHNRRMETDPAYRDRINSGTANSRAELQRFRDNVARMVSGRN